MELYAVVMLEVCMKRDGRTLEEIRNMAVERVREGERGDRKLRVSPQCHLSLVEAGTGMRQGIEGAHRAPSHRPSSAHAHAGARAAGVSLD